MTETQRLLLRYAVMKAAFRAACRAFYQTMTTANQFSKEMKRGDTVRIQLEIVLDGTPSRN